MTMTMTMTHRTVAIFALCTTMGGLGCKETADATTEGTAAAAASGPASTETPPTATGKAKKEAVVAKDVPSKPGNNAESKVDLNPKLAAYVKALLPATEAIPDERKKQLDKLALFVRTKLSASEPASLLFICTHNSRRSHMGQLWAATAAAYFGLDGVKTYSGGTEATAFNPRAVAAMRRAGFDIADGEGDNPHYEATFAKDAPPQECFSKKYGDPFNPHENFAAVMTCSRADKNCPTVEGAVLRIPLPYVDPKESDGTPEEAATYDARAKQVATEMFYLFSRVKA